MRLKLRYHDGETEEVSVGEGEEYSFCPREGTFEILDEKTGAPRMQASGVFWLVAADWYEATA